MKTYSQEEWRNSLEGGFVSNARKKNIERLNEKYGKIKEELLSVIGEGFEKEIAKFGQTEDVFDFQILKVEDLGTYISTMRKVLIERQKEVKNGKNTDKIIEKTQKDFEETLKNSI